MFYILIYMEAKGWGAKVIDKFAMDLTRSFPGIKGLSPRNLKYMRQFASLYPDRVIVQEVLAQLTWYHIITLMDKIKNFQKTLSTPQSDLAQQTIKDPYVFDFLNISQNTKELELQNELLKHITKFLLELGSGFAFVYSQYHLEVSNKDKDRIIAEYALRNITKPMGVSEYYAFACYS